MFNTNRIDDIEEVIDDLIDEINDENKKASIVVKDTANKLDVLMKYLGLEFKVEKSIVEGQTFKSLRGKSITLEDEIVSELKIIKSKKNK